ncbi:MAG: type II toxin-antitoxin system Phd/YefM family antitoxin [Synergistaceae bacterium]|nr:type II toxin-antitoxin system Phd/YefM family antitoxin [Synergistaceae bacterium]
MMTGIDVMTDQKNFDKLIDDVNAGGAPIMIANAKGRSAVLVSEDDWRSIQETLYISSINGMTESIINAGLEKSSECTRYNYE